MTADGSPMEARQRSISSQSYGIDGLTEIIEVGLHEMA
jgi:hypothetical protein